MKELFKWIMSILMVCVGVAALAGFCMLSLAYPIILKVMTGLSIVMFIVWIVTAVKVCVFDLKEKNNE